MAISADPRIGSELVGYRIEALLGRGGMGVVYRAFDLRLKRNVALKLLAPDLAEDERFRERFLRESELAASIDHASIVPVYEAGETDGQLFIAMRYVEGVDLAALLREQGPLERERALTICDQLAGALDAAHERGLVHRDLKPSNVLVDERGHCYLADFGLTRRIAERDDLSQGRMVGTVDYVAPEQIRGEEVDGRADVYSLGCLLFECLTGEPPYPRVSELAILFAHAEEDPPNASERNPRLPEKIDSVLVRALAKSPADRYPTCGELVDATRQALEPLHRNRLLAVAAGLLAAVLVASALSGYFLVRGDGSTAPAAGGVLVRIDPKANDVEGSVHFGGAPNAVAAVANGVWVADHRNGTLWRINPHTLAANAVPSVGAPQDVAVYGGRAFVAGDGPKAFNGIVAAYEAGSGRRLDGLELKACIGSLTAGAQGVWVTPCPHTVQRIGFGAKAKILTSVDIPFWTPRDAAHDLQTLNDLALGEGSLWVIGDAADRRLWKIDPRTGQIVGETLLPFPPIHIAAGQGAVWVTDQLDDTVARIDPTSGQVIDRIPVGRGASGVAVGDGSVWVTSFLEGQVSRIDPRTNRVVETIAVGGGPRDVAFGGHSVWVVGDAD
jgi:YVTN family beta-propeller protein